MNPRLEMTAERKLVGKCLRMSMASNRTRDLWKSFMISRKEIRNAVTTDLLSMQVFDHDHNFNEFDPNKEFDKWAVTEVASFDAVPAGMNTYVLPAGLYAVFLHKGPASAGAKTFQYIFGVWLPQSEYVIDQRPHFEVLGAKYKNDDPDSEEEIWIPIRKI